MDQGDEKKPFQEPDNGVMRSEGNPFQSVIPLPPPSPHIPPIPPQPSLPTSGDETFDTMPIPIVEAAIDSEDCSESGAEDDDRREVYFFRRHLRDILERLLVRSIGPRWYTPFVYTGLVLFILPIVVMVALIRVDLSSAWISLFVSLLISWYPVGREIYRHHTRTVKLIRSERGIQIIYRQPTSLFWGFTGDGDEDESFLEGSTEIRKRIGFLNRFPFFGCGDITIYGKVEGGRIDFRNVPRVKRLQRFLSTQG